MTAPSDWCFPSDAVSFLTDLQANNTRAWFSENKARHEHAVKRPAEVFCEEIRPRLEDLSGRPHASKIFRIYRDVRFSKDKTPYNANLRISFSPIDPSGAAPAWFFSLEPDRLIFGAGCFGFDKPVLERYRQKIAGRGGAELHTLLAHLSSRGIRLSAPDLKRVPKGFDTDQPHSELLLRKSLAGWCDTADTSRATAPGLIAFSLTEYGQLKPLFDWLTDL
ncbi:MAG: DUF2461 domain-containing protein [Pseudomonadota bacterium]